MAVTYGFYNSLNGDRKYDAKQFSSVFDGLLEDGVFSTVGTAFSVTANPSMVDSGNMLIVGPGKAWFYHTWILNDNDLVLELSEADAVLDRIDAIVIDVDARDSVRENSIKVIEGEPSSSPTKPRLLPTPTSSNDHRQYAIAYVTRHAGSTSISQSDIEYVVGTLATPIATGVLQTSENILIANANVLSSSWVADNTYEDYPYKAVIPVLGMTINHIPDVYFDAANALSGVFASFAESGVSSVTIWATELPSTDISVTIKGVTMCSGGQIQNSQELL